MRDVFISHSTADKALADSVVSTLETNGMSCWIAPRDIPAGSNYGAEIAKGIRECSILVLIFSENSHASAAVFREVQMAFEEKKVIIPLRIQEIPPGDDLSFYLSGLHWLDVSPEKLNFDGLLKDVGNARNNIRAKEGAAREEEAAIEPASLRTTPPGQPQLQTPPQTPVSSLIPPRTPMPASGNGVKIAMIAMLGIVMVVLIGAVVFVILRLADATVQVTTEAPYETFVYVSEYYEYPAPQKIPLSALYAESGYVHLSGNADGVQVRDVSVRDYIAMAGQTHYNAIRFRTQRNSRNVSAPRVRQFVLFNLGGEYERLTGYVGRITDSTVADAVFRIYGDDELLVDLEICGMDLPTQINESVRGFRQLRVQITYTVSSREDTVQWGFAAYIKKT